MTSNTRRWMIVATLFVAIVCNYLDRQLLSVLKPEILRHFGIGNIEYAWIVNVFLVCYAAMYPVSGLLVDRFGPKRVMLGGIVTWSLACVGGGLCGPGQVVLFTVFRGILGLAEPTVFASQFIAVTLWFARRERATANSLCQNGGAIGAVLAPVTIAALMGWLDAWQHVFFIAGVTGLVIAAVWAFVYRTPAPDVLARTTDAADGTDSVPAFPLRRLLRTRTLWGGVLIRLVSDPVWYFCCFWLPGFLRRMGEREGLTNAQTLSMIQWIGGLPFLVGAIGAVLASVWSDGLIRRGAPALRARKTVLAFMVALAPACALVPFVDGSALPFGWRVGLVVAAFCLIAVLCNSWLHTIPVTLIEQVPVRNGAFVSGCSCGAGAVGTVVFNQFVGTIPESAWTVLFCAMATFHALAALVLWKMVRPETAKEKKMSGQVDGKTVIGVDFGSDSARAILVDAGTGAILASSSCPYARWTKGYASAPSEARFRQHPLDHWEALRTILHGVLDGFARRETVAGIGVDATASTPCLTDASGTPLALLPEFADDPDAMFVLWKDHTAEEEARLIIAAANADSARYCRHSADTYSPENCWGKVWHILRTNPAVAEKAAGVVESCDWLTSLLAGGPILRSRCAAAYKQMWSPAWGGFPPASFFASLGGTRLSAIRDALAGCRFAPASARAGTLSPAWAEELGLGADVAVGVGNIDAHSGAVGAGCNVGTAAFILGTSGCVMYAVPREAVGERMVPGVFGQVPDGIVEGLEGIEMGQSAFGDAYAWTSRLVSKSAAELDGLASSLSLDGSIPVATDWFNGRRSPFQDASATAAIKGLSLGTDAARLHYAVVEATAFGIRAIIEHLERNGILAERHVAIGGIPRKSPFVMQMLSDVTGKTFEVSSTGDACALGAAMHAAVASGLYGSVAEAQAKMCAPSCATYRPQPDHGHDARYEIYKYMGKY